MSTTTFHHGVPTLNYEGQPAAQCPDELLARYGIDAAAIVKQVKALA